MTASLEYASTTEWVDVCAYDDLLPERGAVALVGETQVALFRSHEGAIYALDNLDPFSGAYVLSRGIVGTYGDIPTVASPMHKQLFDLRTGECLTIPGIFVPTHSVSWSDGHVRVGVRTERGTSQ